MAEKITIEQEIASLMENPGVDPDATAGTNAVETEVEESEDPADGADKAEPKTDAPPTDVEKTPATAIEPPQGLPAAIKSKWANLDPEVQAALQRREEDIHKMFTRNDGELNLGRKMKEVITPYLASIHSEGGTPESAVQSLLNTAYQLRTAQPMQKAQLLAQIAQTYNVDMSLLGSSQQGQSEEQVMALQNKIAEIEQRANPELIINKLREQMDADNIATEVRAFAADPANVHYEAVRQDMAALLQSGRVKDLREAYDKAIWANPETRSTLMAGQEAEKEAKRKTEITAKKKAAMSVTGSSGKPAGSTGATKKSIEDDLREQFDALEGGL